jgi:hypothetical protein
MQKSDLLGQLCASRGKLFNLSAIRPLVSDVCEMHLSVVFNLHVTHTPHSEHARVYIAFAIPWVNVGALHSGDRRPATFAIVLAVCEICKDFHHLEQN